MLIVTNQQQKISKYGATLHRMPCISLAMPFDPKMEPKASIATRFAEVLDTARNQLQSKYAEYKSTPVLEKLRGLFRSVNYNTHKQSIVLFVSPLVEQVYYLDIPVEQKVVIDDDFDIRTLAHSKGDTNKFLVLVISGKQSHIYLSGNNQFKKIVSNQPSHIAAFRNDTPEPAANFSDASKRKEILQEKLLHHTDAGLSLILQSYKLPLFIMGPERIVGHFRKLSHNNSYIMGQVHGNFDEATPGEMRLALSSCMAEWDKLRQENLLNRLEVAKGEQKLVCGIENVWTTAAFKRGRLLVVEENYAYPFSRLTSGKNFEVGNTDNAPLYLDDAVAGVIEKVLKNGGNVEFVDNGLLSKYQHIALTQYY